MRITLFLIFTRVSYVTWYNVMGIRVTFQHRSVAFLPVRYIYVYIYVCKYRYIGTPSQECFTIRRVTYECSEIFRE